MRWCGALKEQVAASQAPELRPLGWRGRGVACGEAWGGGTLPPRPTGRDAGRSWHTCADGSIPHHSQSRGHPSVHGQMVDKPSVARPHSRVCMAQP